MTRVRIANGWIERLPVLHDRPISRYALAIALSAAALAARWALEGSLPPGYPFVTFFPPVILTAFLLGRGPGIFAGVLCGLAAWCFFIPPVGAFAFDSASMIAMGFYVMVIAVDIALVHWMQAANARLLAAREEGRLLAEKSARLAERSELLFQELQHRVGNNLQMVAAVLSLQLRGLDEPSARRAISDAVARVQVIGSIQRRLYGSKGELVPLDRFVGDVCDQIMRSNGRPGVACEVRAQSGLVLPPEAAVPMALILAEAVANALEHGFAGREAGRIAVVLEQQDGAVALSVTDDGVGLPADADPSRAESLGLRISRILSRQLGAGYTLENAKPGCAMRLTLPSGRFAAAG
jgi:two-component sensor histidine kinase